MSLSCFLDNLEIRQIAAWQKEFNDIDINPGFNLFLLISDIYHRENFHSDIIRELLNPFGKHGQKDLYLQQFIQFLNILSKGRIIINYSHYPKAQVLREYGGIDILIFDEYTKHVIIIENKINKAVDRPRQIPRYVDGLLQKGFLVDAVVYLLLNYNFQPAMHDWSITDIDLVKPKLLITPANNNSKLDLVNGWLQPCLDFTEDNETRLIIKQYQTLLKLIGKTEIENNIMEHFYLRMRNIGDFETMRSIAQLYSSLPSYRANRIVENFRDQCNPFESTWCWKDKCAVFESFRYEDTVFTIDIYPGVDNYVFQVFERIQGKLPTNKLLLQIGERENFQENGDRLERIFRFPEQEDDLYMYISTLTEKLAGLITIP